jgi:hypothetical protein
LSFSGEFVKRWKSVVSAVLIAGSTLAAMAGVNSTSAAALPPPAPLGTATLVGEAGDYVVGANSLSFTTITAMKLYSNGVRFGLQSAGHDLNLWFAPPTSQTALTTGVYDGATRGGSSDAPLLSIFGDGRGCNTSTGRFVVESISLDADGIPLAFSAQFEFHCEGFAPAVTGAINYTPPPPRVLPAPTSAGTAILHGDAGEYVLQGQNLSMTVAKYPFQWSDGSLILALTTVGQSYSLTLAPPAGQPWSIGTYERAQRSVFRSPGRPGLDLDGEGRGCNTVSGRFVVDKLVLDATGVPLQLSAQFEFHCEGLIPAVVGSINYGIPPAHLMSLSADSIDFGAAGKKSSAVRTVKVTNDGTSPGFVTKVRFSDRRQEDFEITKNGCEERVLKQGESCSVTLRFAPEKRAGSRATTLTMKDDQGNVHDVQLAGYATGGR